MECANHVAVLRVTEDVDLKLVRDVLSSRFKCGEGLWLRCSQPSLIKFTNRA